MVLVIWYISFLLASPKKWALNGGPWGEGIQFVHVWVVEWYISLSNHLIVKMCVTASGILILRISVWFEVVLYITITAANNLYVIMYIACRSASVKQWRMNKEKYSSKGQKHLAIAQTANAPITSTCEASQRRLKWYW